MNMYDQFSKRAESAMNRRDFLKKCAGITGALALSDFSGCSSTGIRNVPDMKDPGELMLRNCSAVDVRTGVVSPGMDIRISNGRIAGIGRGLEPGERAVVLDAGGRYAIPGLIDGHCHTTISPVFAMSSLDVMKHLRQVQRHYTISIESGVTTVRDTGAFPGALKDYLSDIGDGSLVGPRVVRCNSMLNIRGGHPDVPPTDINPFADIAALFIGMVMTNFRDTAELRAALRDNCRGAAFIKLTVDNRSVFPRASEIPAYTDEHLKIIFDHAARNGLPVACHCHRKWGFDRIIDYPLHSFEHIVSDEVLSDRAVEAMARRGVSIVPTMTIGQSYLMEEAFETLPAAYRVDVIAREMAARREYLHGEAARHCDPGLHAANLALLAEYRRTGLAGLWDKKIFIVDPHLYFGMIINGSINLRKMKEAGITIGCGIDAGMPLSYFGGLYRELEFFTRSGFSNLEALQTATINNAKILRMEDSIGTLEPGKFADVALLDRNPLESISACRSVRLTVKEGRIVHSADPLRMEGRTVVPART